MIEHSDSTRSGMPIGERLGDHPAHRGADDVGGVDPEVVEQPDRVVGHVVERVGAVDCRRRPLRGIRSGTGASSILVECPTSRLSKRIT